MISVRRLCFLVSAFLISYPPVTLNAYRLPPNQPSINLPPPQPPPPPQPINRDYDDGPLPESEPRDHPRSLSSRFNSVYNQRERDRPNFNNYEEVNPSYEDNGGPVGSPPALHHHHNHPRDHPAHSNDAHSSYGGLASERNRPLDSKEALRQDYATSVYSNEHRSAPVPPPSPYPYAPIPVSMPAYPYEPRAYGQVGSTYHSPMPAAVTTYHPYDMPAMSPAVQTAHPMAFAYPNAYPSTVSYPSPYPNTVSNLHQQQQIQNALSSMMARNSFLGFVDPLILLAIIAVPVIAMLGFGSLIMPFIPVIIYVLNIFFPVGNSARKRYRRHHSSATSWLNQQAQQNVQHPLHQPERIDQWLSQLRNATNKFA